LQAGVCPPVVSHGWSAAADRRFHALFDWTGTRDPTAWLCVGEAIRLLGGLLPGGWPELRAHNHGLALAARDLLCDALQIPPPAPNAMLGSLASVPLPASTAPEPPDPLYRRLFERGFEVLCLPFPRWPERVLRVSAQVYNTLEEYRRLARELPALL
jgi:isopenicillin-N epimerase